MKLTDEDKKYLREMYDETEERYLKQIEDCSKKTSFYYINDRKWGTAKKISEAEAIRLLGRERFVSGMHRAAFHRSAIRELPENEDQYVKFDSRAFWR